MDTNQLSSFVLSLGIVAIIGGVLIVIIKTMSDLSILTDKTGGAALNASATAMAGIFNSWYSLVVLAGIAGIVIYLVISGIGGGGKRS